MARSAPSARLTGVLYTLAFLAVCNLVVSGARLATAGGRHLSVVRVAVEVGLAIVCLALAVRRAPGGTAELRPLPTARPARTQPAEAPSARRVWLRRLRAVLVPGLIVLAAISVAGQWDTISDGIGQLGHLHWRWVRYAVYAEALSVVALAWVTRALLRAGGRRMAMGRLIALSLASNAMATSIPGGPAWAASFCFEQFRHRGLSRGRAAVVLALTLLASIASLVVLTVVGVDLAGSRGPAAGLRPLATAGLLVLGGLGALLCTRPGRRACMRLLGRFGGLRRLRAVRSLRARLGAVTLPRLTPGRIAEVSVAAVLNWLADCACLVAALLAVGAHVPWAGLLVVYGATQIAANLPVTPGGVGVVEGTLSLLLIAYGMAPQTAVAAVLLYRIISFWVLVPLGWLAAGGLVWQARRVRRSTPAVGLPAGAEPPPRPARLVA